MKKNGFLSVMAALAVLSLAGLFLAGCSNGDGDGGGTQTGGKTLVSIAVTTHPTKTQYNLNEDLNTAGMVVTATYSDNSTAAVTGFSTSGYDKTKTGSQTVTVTYQGKTASFTVTVIDPSKETAATPTATPAAGEVADNSAITLATATAGAVIYYTQDGTEPNTTSALYSDSNKPVITTGKLTLKAIAVKDGMNNSTPLTAVYTIAQPSQTAATPTATPAGGEVADNTAITLATATTGAAVYYTQDGTEPGTASALYSDSNKPVITTGKLTLKAIAVKDGMNNSAMLTAVYTIAQPPQTAATPTATPAGGEVADNTAITLATATTGAAVYYTQDGTEPGTASALYSDSNKPVITMGKLTLKAIAVKDGMNTSAMLTAVYTIIATTPITGVTLDKTSISLIVGETETLTATVSPDNADNKEVTWASNNTAVVTVDSNGLVTPIKSGTATITVTTTDGNFTAQCTVTVSLVAMVQIPGGSFEMGKELGTDVSNDTTPVHTVTLSGFYMGKYQVTQAQYQAVMGSNPSSFSSNPASGEVQRNRPVEQVSWYDAIVFCNKLSIAEGLTPAYSISNSTNPEDWGTVPTSNDSTWNAAEIVSGSTGYRLPTEAQWEYAAKGGDGTPGNYMYSGSNNVDEVAWYSSNSDQKSHEVGKKLPNGLGIYDMSGNVFEWCWDWYGVYTSVAQNDPAGPASGSYRMLRGGYWGYSESSARLVARYYSNPYDRGSSSDFGIRLVRP